MSPATSEATYDREVEPFRGALQAHCYRMLGSVHEAEDAVQEALTRAWRSFDRFEGRSSTRSWLYRIATNVCLDHAEQRKRRVLPIELGPATDPQAGPGEPLLESVWVEPYPAGPEHSYEERETLELAFVAALQHLPARQRAVLILCEVLQFSAKETAEVLETTVASVTSALQRARAGLEAKAPDRSQQATLAALGDDGVRELVERYVDAWQRGDVDAVAAMLASDAALTMPPMPTWFRGADEVLVFLREWAFSGRAYDQEGRRRVRVVPTSANGSPAFATYAWSPEHGDHRPTVLQVLTLDADGRIAEITGFVEPAVFRHFDVPPSLP